MPLFVFTATADIDAAAIFDDLYIRAGKTTVVKYRALFRRLYGKLAAFPDSGALRHRLGPNIRIGIVSPYLVIYHHTASDDTVSVLRIVHAKRRITGRILRERL